MNKQRRKRLNDAAELLRSALDIVNECRDEEEEAMENMPESLQESDRYCELEENCETLSDIADSIDETISDIEDITEV